MPEKCSTGKSVKSKKSPCRHRHDAQRFQVWKEKMERTSDSNPSRSGEKNKEHNRQVQDPDHHRPGEASQRKRQRHKGRIPRPAAAASPQQYQDIPPLVGAISLDHNSARCNTSTQTDRQVTTACATQTAHPGVTSKGVQALCPVPSHTRSPWEVIPSQA